MINIQILNQLRKTRKEEWKKSGISLRVSTTNRLGFVNSGLTETNTYFYWDYILKSYAIGTVMSINDLRTL